MREIKDYLHLYLGCEVLVDGDTTGTLAGVSHTYDVELYVNNQWLHHRFCKLILRPLSDITAEEHMTLFKVDPYSNTNAMFRGITPEATRFLLSKGFDLFGLIEAGLAIDKTKLEQGERIGGKNSV